MWRHQSKSSYLTDNVAAKETSNFLDKDKDYIMCYLLFNILYTQYSYEKALKQWKYYVKNSAINE